MTLDRENRWDIRNWGDYLNSFMHRFWPYCCGSAYPGYCCAGGGHGETESTT